MFDNERLVDEFAWSLRYAFPDLRMTRDVDHCFAQVELGDGLAFRLHRLDGTRFVLAEVAWASSKDGFDGPWFFVTDCNDDDLSATADIGDVRTVLELSVVLESLCGDLKRFHARIKAEGVRLHVFA